MLILDHQWSSVSFSGDIYLSPNIFSSFVSEIFCGDVFETLLILLSILYPTKLPAVCAVF